MIIVYSSLSSWKLLLVFLFSLKILGDSPHCVLTIRKTLYQSIKNLIPGLLGPVSGKLKRLFKEMQLSLCYIGALSQRNRTYVISDFWKGTFWLWLLVYLTPSKYIYYLNFFSYWPGNSKILKYIVGMYPIIKFNLDFLKIIFRRFS